MLLSSSNRMLRYVNIRGYGPAEPPEELFPVLMELLGYNLCDPYSARRTPFILLVINYFLPILKFVPLDPDSDVPANTIYLYATGDDILRPFSYTSEHYWRNVGCLIALAVGFRFIGYLVLAFKFRKANR